jgi:hypothetical protein
VSHLEKFCTKISTKAIQNARNEGEDAGHDQHSEGESKGRHCKCARYFFFFFGGQVTSVSSSLGISICGVINDQAPSQLF